MLSDLKTSETLLVRSAGISPQLLAFLLHEEQCALVSFMSSDTATSLSVILR